MPRSLGREENSVTEMVESNGTMLVRTVDARWECTFPEGNCFTSHAPLEGMPEKLDACTKEENQGPLTVNMVVDLHCAGMALMIQCNEHLNSQPFDPFYYCNNDPLLIVAQCHLECHDSFPFEVCTFNFDQRGIFNMSDKTIDTCQMQGTCKSPYIEQNQMYCSTHDSAMSFVPHWINQERPWKSRSNNSLQAPHMMMKMRAPVQQEGPTVIGQVLWVCATFALIAAVSVALYRYTQRADDETESACCGYCLQVFGGKREPRFGPAFRLPAVMEFPARQLRPMQASQYVAPAEPPALPKRQASSADQEEDEQPLARDSVPELA